MTGPVANLQVERASDTTFALSNSASVTSGNRGNLAWYNSAVSTVATIRAGADTDNVGTKLQFFTRPVGGAMTETFTLESDGSATFGAQVRVPASAVSAPGYSFNSDTNTGIYSNVTGYLMFAADGTQGMQMTDTALEMKVPIQLETSLTSGVSGTIIKIGNGTLTAGKCYVLLAGTWEETDPTDEEFSKQLLGIALGSGATTATDDGMLTNGIFYDSAHGFTVGEPIFLSTTAGTLTTTAPTTSGDLVRVVGYAIDTDEIYFCPDNTWVILD